MGTFEPFAGQLIAPDWSARVVAPAYDSMEPEERIEFRRSNPDSYLHVTRAPGDEPDGESRTDVLVARGRAALDRLLDIGAFAERLDPAYHVYRLELDGHAQTGLVGDFAPRAFAELARPHEQTRPERAALLADHVRVVGAASSPVALALDDDGAFAALLDTAATGVPAFDLRSADGLRQQVWRVSDPELHAQFATATDGRAMYIVDGHHRAAANKALLTAGQGVPLLCAVFPAPSLRVLGFHRLLPADSAATARLTRQVARRFHVELLADFRQPDQQQVAMWAGGSWSLVHFDERPVSTDAAIRRGALDPVVLDREILRSFADPADISYVPGTAAPDEVRRIAAGRGAVAFLVPPVELPDVFTVADGGLTLPPKSTYFVPKVRSGIFLRRYLA